MRNLSQEGKFFELTSRANVEKRSFKVPVFETFDGREIALSVHQFKGGEGGPSVYVGASTHGNELHGGEICRRLLADLDSQDLFGTVTIIPVQNPIAYESRSR